MRNRYAAGFFGVILEVSLSFLVRVVADDLDGVLVCTNGTVSAETPEFTSLCALRSNIRIFGTLNGKVCNIIKDGKCKFFLRFIRPKVFVCSKNISRLYILGPQAVSAAADQAIFKFRASDSSNHIEEQRLAQAARLFCSVQNRDFLDGLWHNLEEVFV